VNASQYRILRSLVRRLKCWLTSSSLLTASFSTHHAKMSPSARKKPDLDHCVETLESISRDVPTKASPKTIGELYLAAVGLLCHLKADQVTLRESRYVVVVSVFAKTLNRKCMF
jgi:hypothetical protein